LVIFHLHALLVQMQRWCLFFALCRLENGPCFSPMKNVDWNDYQVFLAVGRLGGLSAAAEATSLSPATISRKMLALEAETGLSLFARSQTGYQLTAEGAQLFDQLAEMEASARKVEQWRLSTTSAATVRIACGTWIARLLSQNMAAIFTERDQFRLELMIAERRSNLAHRESDIGIRAFAPEESNLAAVRLGDIFYCAYHASNLPLSASSRWVAVDEEDAISAYLKWPRENHSDQIAISVNRPHSLKDLAAAGAGTVILPCFVGDLEPRLQRSGQEIAALRHGQWLVMNNDDRHRDEIRTAADRIIRLLKQHKDLFEGKRAVRNAG
jgi:DNA-binding transcriptional LysR family regulator